MTWRAPTADDRRIAWLWALCAVLVLGLRPLWAMIATVLPACPWRQLTGFACPGCGTTRAVLRLLRFDFASGFVMNPLSFTAAAAFLVLGLIAPVWVALGRNVPEPSPGPKWGWGLAAAAGLGLNWVWLVATGV